MEFNTTIQGEGINVGKPVILVRFNGCFLRCEWCDTKQSWTNKETPYKDIKKQIDNLINNYCNIDTLLITGGEPLLNNQCLDVLHTYYNQFNLEIETNGLLLENIIDDRYVNDYKDKLQLNISPKFNIESYPKEFNINKLSQIFALYKIQFKLLQETDIKYTVKFVYGDHVEYCGTTILSFIIMNNIPKDKIVIMAFTPDKNKYIDPNGFLKDFNQNCKATIEFCLEHGFRYSPREHIDLNIA